MTSEGNEARPPLFVLEGDAAIVHRVAQALAPHIVPGTWVFLEGDLGAGKTTLTQALLAFLGAKEAARSPTFSLLDVTELQPPWNGISRVLHLDLYRIVSGRELCYLGLEQEFSSESLALFEWASQVDDDDWKAFFATTGCRLPKRLLEMTIARVAGRPDARRYVLS